MNIDKKKLLLALAKTHETYLSICKRAGINYQTLRMALNGERHPKPCTIGKLAYALGVNVQDIIESR